MNTQTVATKRKKRNLLGIGSDAKTVKGEKIGILTGILYLAPSNESGVINVCPHATAGCRSACLFTAGRGAMRPVKSARVSKTLHFVNSRQDFMLDLSRDIADLVFKANDKKMSPAVRLNGTSDIAWEDVTLDGKNIMDTFSTVQFYDYTKSMYRVRAYAAGKLPANYHLTFSKSENNDVEVAEAISLGVNVAVVFAGKMPDTYLGRPVVNGDESDVRFGDPKGCIVGLTAKGKAKKDTSGFVVKE